MGAVAELLSATIKSILEEHMLKAVWSGFALAVCLGSLTIAASAQQVVHALTGTVSSIDGVAKTLTVFQDNGSEKQFKDMIGNKSRVVIDKKISLDSMTLDASKAKGSYVIVFYCGDNDARSVVALKDLGAGPFTSAEGTVTKFEGKGHSISIQDKTGATQTFRIAPETIAEGYMGVVDGFKFGASKGDRIRVVASTDGGALTALFVRQM
jgi:hypothetical protein